MNNNDIEIQKKLITDIDMIYYPLLPVVNRSQVMCGIIIAEDNVKLPLKVYLGNIFGLRDDGIKTVADIRKKYKYLEFETLDAFLESGWCVD